MVSKFASYSEYAKAAHVLALTLNKLTLPYRIVLRNSAYKILHKPPLRPLSFNGFRPLAQQSL